MNGIAVHGFGRIGRSLPRVASRDDYFTPIAISDIKDLSTLAALFAVDTNYGRWPEEVGTNGDTLVVGSREMAYIDTTQDQPDWRQLGVAVVVDCTGRATTRSGAQTHLDHGAERVLVSAPSKTVDDCDAVLLPGINLDQFDLNRHRIVSMASCTTNALAPVVKVVRERFGIRHGLFSTVPAYTNSQSLTDQPMQERRDSSALAILERAGFALGAAIGSMINVFNPELVVVGGGVAAAGNLLLEPARDAVRQHAFPVPRAKARIVRSDLGADTGLFGAAALVLANHASDEAAARP